MTIQNQAFPHKLRYHHLMVAVLIVLLALTVRFVVMYQRAHHDPSFIPAVGTDHHYYLETAKGVLDGTFPSDSFLFHPGPSYVFAGIYWLLGTDNFVLTIFVIALLDALTCGLLIASGWLLSQRTWGGYLAGGIYAIYPIAIFYATTPLIAPLAGFFVSGFICFVLWQRNQLTLWRTILIGIFAGLIAIHRLNLAPMVGLYGLWLLLLPFSWRDRIVHGIVFALITISMIAPFTYLNYQNSGGDFTLIAKTGSAELYMGNNRDSAGRHGSTLAYQNVDMSYTQAFLRDARVAPEHTIGLFAYKFALFWSNVEPGNNLTFDFTRERSSLLDNIPLRFSWIAILGLLGLSALWYQHRDSAIFLGLMLAWMCFGYVLIFAFGRIRFPAVIPLTLLTSFALMTIYDIVLHGINWEQLTKRYGIATIGIVVLYIFVNWSLFPEPKLPPERTYTELPLDAVRLDAEFGEVTLVGWRYLNEWDYVRNGWIPTFESYAIELFWQVTDSTNIPYNFFIAYIDGNQRYDAIDSPLGAVSFPSTTTDEWQQNRLYGEIVALRLDDDVPQGISGQIRVGVWYWDDAGTIVNVPLASGDPNLLIQTIAVFDDDASPTPPDLPQSDIVFGDLIVLRGYDLPNEATSGETISLEFYWESVQNVIDDYNIFIHVVDTTGEIVSQGDNRLIPNLLTSNWITNYPLHSELPLELPASSGTFEIYAGLYNRDGRLLVGTPDDRILLGTITVIEE